jgi:hypothetical protein
MNSLSSIQGINNKVINNIISIVVPDGDFGLPVVASGARQSIVSFNNSGSFSYESWTLNCTFTSGSQFNVVIDHNPFPTITEVSTAYPQCMQVNPNTCVATLTLSQPISFPQAGTYQLSFYLAPNTGYYQTYFTINASVGSTSMGAVSLNPSAGWVNYTMNFVVSSTMSETLTITFNSPNSSNNMALYLAAVTITYLHA